MSTVAEGQFYQFTSGKDHMLLHLKGGLMSSEENTVPSEFIKEIKKIVENPQNVIVNCFLIDTIEARLMETFCLLHYQLMLKGKKLYFINVNLTFKQKFQRKEFQRLPVIESLFRALELINENVAPPTNLSSFKTLINATTKTLFFITDTSFVRNEIFIKNRENKAKFSGDLTSFVQVINDNYFYVLSLSFPIKTYNNLYAQRDPRPQKEVLTDLMNKFVTMALEDISKQHNINIDFPQIIDSATIPTIEGEFKDQKYQFFHKGETVVIPFSSSIGQFFIELWIPSDFHEEVLKSIHQ